MFVIIVERRQVACEQRFLTSGRVEVTAPNKCLLFPQVSNEIGSCIQGAKQKVQRGIIQHVNKGLARVKGADCKRRTARDAGESVRIIHDLRAKNQATTSSQFLLTPSRGTVSNDNAMNAHC